MNLKHLSVCPARLFITGAAGLFFALSTLAQTTLTQPSLTALERQYHANPADTSRSVAFANALRSRGDWFQQMPHYSRDSAAAYYKRAIALLRQTNPQPEEALMSHLVHIGRYYLQLKHDPTAAARPYLDRAWATAQQQQQRGMKNPSLFYDIRSLQAQWELYNGDAKRALAMMLEAVGLIVNELLTNALKYAFPAGQAGRVRLEDLGAGRLRLLVSDNGIGKVANGTSISIEFNKLRVV